MHKHLFIIFFQIKLNWFYFKYKFHVIINYIVNLNKTMQDMVIPVQILIFGHMSLFFNILPCPHTVCFSKKEMTWNYDIFNMQSVYSFATCRIGPQNWSRISPEWVHVSVYTCYLESRSNGDLHIVETSKI